MNPSRQHGRAPNRTRAIDDACERVGSSRFTQYRAGYHSPESSIALEPDMTMPHDEPSLDDVLEPEEKPVMHRREHGKASPHPDEDELDERLDIERHEVGLDSAHDG